MIVRWLSDIHFGNSADHFVPVIESSNIHCTVSKPIRSYPGLHVNVAFSLARTKLDDVEVILPSCSSDSWHLIRDTVTT